MVYVLLSFLNILLTLLNVLLTFLNILSTFLNALLTLTFLNILLTLTFLNILLTFLNVYIRGGLFGLAVHGEHDTSMSPHIKKILGNKLIMKLGK